MGFDVRSDLRAASLLSALGFDPRQIMANLDQRGQMGGLDELGDGFERMGSLGPAGILGLLQQGAFGRSLRMPLPGEQERRFSRGWPDTEGGFDPSQFPNGSAGQRLAAFFRRQPFARQQLERQLGGRIVPSSLSPAGFRVQQFAPGAFPGGGLGNNAALSAFSTLAGIDRAASAFQVGGAFGQQNAFQTMVLGAFAQMAEQQAERVQAQQRGIDVLTTADLLDMNPDGTPRGAAASRALNAANFGAGGFAPGFPAFGNATGFPSGAQGAFAPGADLSGSGIMNEPGLTVEDKVCLLIMIIMKQMDQQIEAQANYINSLQQQQNAGGGGKGGKGGQGGKGGKGGGGSGAPSIDVETMKLKRLIDKRSQMFDMLRQIIDKYNQTAKGIIDSMGR